MKTSVLDSLPNRPLKLEEYNKISDKDNVVDSIPFYGGLANQSSFGELLIPGFILATNKNMVIVAHNTNEDSDEPQWYVVSSTQTNCSNDEIKEMVNESFSILKNEFNATSGLRE